MATNFLKSAPIGRLEPTPAEITSVSSMTVAPFSKVATPLAIVKLIADLSVVPKKLVVMIL